MISSKTSHQPIKFYGFNRNTMKRLWIGMLTTVTLILYASFYPSQLIGPFNWPIFVLAVILTGMFLWSAIMTKHIDPHARRPLQIWHADTFLVAISILWVTWTLLLGALDVTEHAINRKEWRTELYPVTGIGHERRGRLFQTNNIQFDVEGQFLPAKIQVPYEQVNQLELHGYVGLCVGVYSRPTILTRKQIVTGCSSKFCSVERAVVIACPNH